MKPNGDMCHFLVITEKSVSVNIDRSNVKNKKFDSSDSFDFSSLKDHIKTICKKTHT